MTKKTGKEAVKGSGAALLGIGAIALVFLLTVFRKKAEAIQPDCAVDSDCQPGEICVDGECVPDDGGTPSGCLYDSECPPGFVCQNGVCVLDTALPADVQVVNFSVPEEVPVGGQTSVYFDLVNNGGTAAYVSRVSVCTEGWCDDSQSPGITLQPGQSASFNFTLLMNYLGEVTFEVAVDEGSGFGVIFRSASISVI